MENKVQIQYNKMYKKKKRVSQKQNLIKMRMRIEYHVVLLENSTNIL